MTNLLATEYQLIFKQIQQASQTGSHLFDQGIGDIRRRHWDLSQVVSKVDDIFCAHIALNVIASLLLSCFGLYTVIWNKSFDEDALSAITEFSWVPISLAKLTSDCVSGIMLNDAVSILHSHYVAPPYIKHDLPFCD